MRYIARSSQIVTIAYLMLMSIAISATNAYANQESIKLPDLGSPDLVAYDKNTEERLGRAFTASLHRDFSLLDDLEINHYIRQLGHKIAGYTGSDRHFSFYVIDDDTINAFAGPDGVIGIHTGLIMSVRNEDELAAVIAHEISHVTQNHLSRRYEYASSQGNLNSIATLLAAILIGMHDPNAGMATLMGGMGYNLQQQLKNSRAHESEADAIGIQLLYQAGYDPHAMGDFFEYLSKEQSINTLQVPEILRTHPVSDNRLAEADNRAQQLEKKISKINIEDFQLIRERLAFKKGLKTLTVKPESSTTSFSRDCYQNLLKEKTNNTSTCMTAKVLNTKASPYYFTEYLNHISTHDIKLDNKNSEALKDHAKLLIDLYPNNVPLLITFSKFLKNIGENQKGITLLEHHLRYVKYSYDINKYLSEAYSKLNQEGLAYLYLAYANIEIGNIERAKYYYEQAEKHAGKNDQTIEKKIATFKHKYDKLLKNLDK